LDELIFEEREEGEEGEMREEGESGVRSRKMAEGRW